MQSPNLSPELARLDERTRHLEQRLAQEIEVLNQRLLEKGLLERQRYEAHAAAVDAAFAAIKEAVNKSEQATEKRFDSNNEFRGQLNDIVGRLMPRNESNSRFDALRGEFAGRFDNLSDKIDRMRERLDKSEGSGRGIAAGWGYLLGAVTLIATISAIVATVSKFAS